MYTGCTIDVFPATNSMAHSVHHGFCEIFAFCDEIFTARVLWIGIHISVYAADGRSCSKSQESISCQADHKDFN
jgi:hypothetical protein